MKRMRDIAVRNPLLALLAVTVPSAMLFVALHSGDNAARHQPERHAMYSAWYVTKVDGKRYIYAGPFVTEDACDRTLMQMREAQPMLQLACEEA